MWLIMWLIGQKMVEIVWLPLPLPPWSGCVCLFFFPLGLCLPLPLLLCMEAPTSDDTPSVTRRGTTHGDNAPPKEFDKGWSSLRRKNSTGGVCMTPPPIPSLSSTPSPHIPTLALSFAGITLGPPVQQSTLTASSRKKTTPGVCMTSPPISPLLHLSPSLPPPSHPYARCVCVLRWHDLSTASTTIDFDRYVGQNVYWRCVRDPSPHPLPPARLSCTPSRTSDLCLHDFRTANTTTGVEDFFG